MSDTGRMFCHSSTASLGYCHGVVEIIFWYFDYAYFNNTGERPVGLTTWVVTIGATRRTVSRLLILSISMGYNYLFVLPLVVSPQRATPLLELIFIASILLNVTEYVGTINDIAGRARVLLVLPDALLDAFLILWIFTSLSKTLEQLRGKEFCELDIYRQFSNALTITVIASIAWIGYEVYFKATDPFNEWWQGGWIITAFWDILAFGLLCVICYLWAPSRLPAW
ncbi:hypothetical protein HAX54_045165 [Datura stramonium]|uniref:GOST seven transmembrane domain-containing protein n=1 Tax=Datura stramonium TaxID=4076 RepID=A0ABS8SQ25_DATST|nr:hypothetical protein [Datura stramonium]